MFGYTYPAMMAVANAYARSKDNKMRRNMVIGILVIVSCLYGLCKLTFAYRGNTSFLGALSKEYTISTATWNIAAINNNPFEYWITNDDPEYNNLMRKVSKFITEPGDKDVPVSSIFTPSMFKDLMKHMENYTDWSGFEETKKMWESDFSKRKIISEFLKDPLLGKKRLISMTDRVTNTINVDKDSQPLTRPTVINCYDGKTLDGSVVTLDSIKSWWPACSSSFLKQRFLR